MLSWVKHCPLQAPLSNIKLLEGETLSPSRGWIQSLREGIKGKPRRGLTCCRGPCPSQTQHIYEALKIVFAQVRNVYLTFYFVIIVDL